MYVGMYVYFYNNLDVISQFKYSYSCEEQQRGSRGEGGGVRPQFRRVKFRVTAVQWVHDDRVLVDQSIKFMFY
jgi:hypothetical protein